MSSSSNNNAADTTTTSVPESSGGGGGEHHPIQLNDETAQRMSAQLSHVKAKYAQNAENYKKNTGHEIKFDAHHDDHTTHGAADFGKKA